MESQNWVSTPVIRLFYDDLRFMRFGEVETLVVSKRIYLDYTMFDALFNINCSDFSTFFKNPWLFDFGISFEQEKKFIALDNSEALPSALSS